MTEHTRAEVYTQRGDKYSAWAPDEHFLTIVSKRCVQRPIPGEPLGNFFFQDVSRSVASITELEQDRGAVLNLLLLPVAGSA